MPGYKGVIIEEGLKMFIDSGNIVVTQLSERIGINKRYIYEQFPARLSETGTAGVVLCEGIRCVNKLLPGQIQKYVRPLNYPPLDPGGIFFTLHIFSTQLKLAMAFHHSGKRIVEKTLALHELLGEFAAYHTQIFSMVVAKLYKGFPGALIEELITLAGEPMRHNIMFCDADDPRELYKQVCKNAKFAETFPELKGTASTIITNARKYKNHKFTEDVMELIPEDNQLGLGF